MDFEVEIVKDLANNPIKSQLAEPRSAPPTMPDKPFIGAVVASRGGGKTTSIINLVGNYAKTRFFDKVVLMSPTYRNDTKLERLDDDRYDFTVQEDVNYDTINDTIESIKADIEEYKLYKDYMAVWKRFIRARSAEGWLKRASPEEIAILQHHDFQPPETRFKYGMPTTLVIFDDLVGNRAVYNNQELVKFLLVHRHWLTSVIFSVQVFRGAIPRGLRNNLSLLVLFRNKNSQIRREVAEELSSHITVEQFEKLWDYCCAEQHDFFMINFDSKEYRFRKNFNEIIRLKAD
jgi:hypothetical protein